MSREFLSIACLGVLVGSALACGGSLTRSFEVDDDDRVRHLATGIVLVRIEPGRFSMGSPGMEAKRDCDEILHEAEIPEAFLLGESEVTVA